MISFLKREAGNKRINRQCAIVMGGSVAGLLTAKVLSQHYSRVVILERDPITKAAVARKGQPQALHTHVLLGKGFEILKHYFPELREKLIEHGAGLISFAQEAGFYTHGDQMKNFESDLEYVAASRPLLESIIRNELLKNSNIEIRDCCKITGLEFSEDGNQVLGVQVEDRQAQQNTLFNADLIVDASGRGSRTPRWLEQAGFESPQEEKIEIDVGYATRLYERAADDQSNEKMVCITPEGGKELTGGCLVPIENGRWICTLSGWGGQHASSNENEFMEFVDNLPSSSLGQRIKSLKPASDILLYKYPASLRRRYDLLKKFPKNLLVLGDAVCSFNPIYGQGMTSSALQAKSLDCLLSTSTGTPDARRYFRQTAKYVARAWNASAVSDYQYPTTKGKAPFLARIVNAYMKQVIKTSHESSTVYNSFLQVTNLMKSPNSLFSPGVVSRVFWSCTKRAFGGIANLAHNENQLVKPTCPPSKRLDQKISESSVMFQ